jgi:Zn finger protein HypA/HybF involved in hydrogenase expression
MPESTTTPPSPQPTTIIDDTTPSFTTGTPQNPCENCHLTGKPGVPQADRVHNEMARYCMLCHSVNHETHPMPDDGVACSGCHGESAAVPTLEEGAARCGKCHNYPDPLTPSNGNLILVHRPRDVGCPSCHGGNVMDIHLSGKNVHIEDMLKRIGQP